MTSPVTGCSLINYRPFHVLLVLRELGSPFHSQVRGFLLLVKNGAFARGEDSLGD